MSRVCRGCFISQTSGPVWEEGGEERGGARPGLLRVPTLDDSDDKGWSGVALSLEISRHREEVVGRTRGRPFVLVAEFRVGR